MPYHSTAVWDESSTSKNSEKQNVAENLMRGTFCCHFQSSTWHLHPGYHPVHFGEMEDAPGTRYVQKDQAGSCASWNGFGLGKKQPEMSHRCWPSAALLVL